MNAILHILGSGRRKDKTASGLLTTWPFLCGLAGVLSS